MADNEEQQPTPQPTQAMANANTNPLPTTETEQAPATDTEQVPTPSERMKVKCRGPGDQELEFTLKPTTPLHKMMRAYGQRLGFDPRALRFVFEGQRIIDEHKPTDLDLDDGCVIDVFGEQIGGDDVTNDDTHGEETEPPQVEQTVEKLSITCRDQTNEEITFSVKPGTKLGKMMEVYAERVSTRPHLLRFLFEGTRIIATSTPAELEMEEGDVIDVFAEQIGGADAPENANKQQLPEENTDMLSIRCVDQTNQEVFFKIKKSTRLCKLMDAYSARFGFNRRSLRFLFDGARFHDDDTPETLEMDDNEVIMVYLQIPNGPCNFCGTVASKIQVSFRLHHFEQTLKLVRTAKLGVLAEFWSGHLACETWDVQFTFNGRRCGMHETPDSLNMENGSVIHVSNQIDEDEVLQLF